ncbi:PREDICTED: protein farnesyltransferase/geranylgeranyltransferase type-1 subunit alpha-like [Amphimedon queenslandica]|uniref:Protein farnesyltransferase/geranylgeranyltransferase type-1 subunit alpha n=1 Tax=Amphimedon queenslandica TaxID=400682 RepID=A0AAN0IAF5_AMPQE|nr:PREDICTED: protein farnesyltransferase/geranylgeranyltransferase type-1 subunit alpha-like [Amphimedon queenslandica]|eukprot:XP_003383939.1 PREDICTED: protein farnesyltransferase/geranylgeranyltransferase type-1 subunit alpha-like [Amphimedon queenslandica]
MSEGDESNSDEQGYVYYRDRPNWKDIEPIPQDDGPNPVVQIAYTDKFKDVYDYLRAVIRKGEKTERVLELTMDAIECNPANYTVWHYRREVLQELKKDLKSELEFAEETVLNEPKNYQVWYHRQKLVEWSNDPSRELYLTAEVFKDDSKNYHAWQHRQWTIRTYGLWSNELEFVDGLLKEDFRNNSAWNQRYFVIINTTGYTEEVVKNEVKYVIDFIKVAPNNESAWNYLTGILKGGRISDHEPVLKLIDSLRSQHVPSPFLLSTMIDVYEEEVANGKKESLEKAVKICEELGSKIDPVRKRYWEYTSRRLISAYGPLDST